MMIVPRIQPHGGGIAKAFGLSANARDRSAER
jgi:hypothetical protein